MRSGLLALIALLVTPFAAPSMAWSMTPPAQPPQTCPPQGGFHFICGLTNPEDLFPLANGRWLLASSFKEGSAGFYLVDTAAKTARSVALSLSAHPARRYAGCAPPDLKRLSTHGLDAKPARDGSVTVYAVNHGGRESIEVFRLMPAKASAEWIGCVLAPPNASLNAVAALPGGGLVFTKQNDLNDPDVRKTLTRGVVSGMVYRWSPGKGISEVSGTRLSGDNGLVVSADGKQIFLAAFGAREVWRLPLSGGSLAAHVKLPFHPDNLRWTKDGALLAAGQHPRDLDATGPTTWSVARLDPLTLGVRPVLTGNSLDGFRTATTAVEINGTLWLGSFIGDRLIYTK